MPWRLFCCRVCFLVAGMCKKVGKQACDPAGCCPTGTHEMHMSSPSACWFDRTGGVAASRGCIWLTCPPSPRLYKDDLRPVRHGPVVFYRRSVWTQAHVPGLPAGRQRRRRRGGSGCLHMCGSACQQYRQVGAQACLGRVKSVIAGSIAHKARFVLARHCKTLLGCATFAMVCHTQIAVAATGALPYSYLPT